MNTDEHICRVLHINVHLAMDSPCDNYISSNISLHVTDDIQTSYTVDCEIFICLEESTF
jgi:hypothetical protein